MPKLAKAYISVVVILGSIGTTMALLEWECADIARYVVYAVMAILAACFKVRLPGMQGTISVSFVLLLIGVAELSYAETLLMAGVVAVVQSFWKSRRPPRPAQVLFNTAVLIISAAASYRAAREVAVRAHCPDLLILMPVAAVVYFISNTVMVSGVLGLIQRQPVLGIWKTCHLWSFPYYLVGAAVAVLSVSTSRAAGWQASLLVLPLMQMAYLYYRTFVERFAEAQWGKTIT